MNQSSVYNHRVKPPGTTRQVSVSGVHSSGHHTAEPNRQERASGKYSGVDFSGPDRKPKLLKSTRFISFL
ncbi:unnamed protein product [Cochlearia groenlandica]